MTKTAWFGIGVFALALIAAVALFALPAPSNAPQSQGNAPEKQNLITVSSLRPGDRVSSPFIVRGEARGNWYFEASFPIELRDASGNTIAEGYAQAQGEWMTTDFVPFESIAIAFPPQPAGAAGTLILHKDNPSGLPENDDQLVIPVVF